MPIFMQLADGVEIPNHKIKLIRFEGSEGQKNPHSPSLRRLQGTILTGWFFVRIMTEMVTPDGLEPSIFRLEGGCFIQLSYGVTA